MVIMTVDLFLAAVLTYFIIFIIFGWIVKFCLEEILQPPSQKKSTPLLKCLRILGYNLHSFYPMYIVNNTIIT
jgi:hypothetical protein